MNLRFESGVILEGSKIRQIVSNPHSWFWKRVIITSVLPPEDVYKNMVSENWDKNTIKQLYRRIAKVVYHYKDGEDYKTIKQSMAEYTDYASLRSKATDDFVKLTPAEEK